LPWEPACLRVTDSYGGEAHSDARRTNLFHIDGSAAYEIVGAHIDPHIDSRGLDVGKRQACLLAAAACRDGGAIIRR
jgi:hypothetical protein